MNMEVSVRPMTRSKRFWIVGLVLASICLILIYTIPPALYKSMQDPFNMTYAPTTVYPTDAPTTIAPTKAPTKAPSKAPTKAPTVSPTTAAPTP